MSRFYTNKLLDLVDGGTFDKDRLIKDLLGYLSESEVEDFATTNGYIEEDEPEEYDDEEE